MSNIKREFHDIARVPEIIGEMYCTHVFVLHLPTW